jgi:radical SAM protein with 4Fe4S-binding SPASM domain
MGNLTDIIVILIVAAVIGAICFYLWRQKKNGAKCIGCPHSKSCSGRCGMKDE